MNKVSTCRKALHEIYFPARKKNQNSRTVLYPYPDGSVIRSRQEDLRLVRVPFQRPDCSRVPLYNYYYRPDWKNSHSLSERLESLGIMEAHVCLHYTCTPYRQSLIFTYIRNSLLILQVCMILRKYHRVSYR